MQVSYDASRFPMRRLGRWGWTCVIGFVVAAVAVRVAGALIRPTIQRPDEVFQNLEPAYRLWTGQGVVSWEWRTGIRSWLFPGFLSALMSLTSLLHLPEAAALPLIWTVLSVVAAGVVAAGVIIGWRRFGFAGAILCGTLTAFWPDLVYFGPKTLGEVQAGNLLVIAAALASAGPSRRGVSRLLSIGVLLGIAFTLRFQLGLAYLLVACWAARQDFARSWGPLIVGAAIPVATLGFVDWWTLGSPFQSIWKNIVVNMLEHKADFFGTDPFYKYISFIIVRNGAISVLMAVLFVLGFGSAPLLALTSLVVVIFHSLIAHKEISFIYAGLPCALIVVGLGLTRLTVGLRRSLIQRPTDRVAIGTATALTLAIIVAVNVAEKPFEQHPAFVADLRGLFRDAHAKPDLCGLALIMSDKTMWAQTGGYVTLARSVPLYMVTTASALSESAEGFNYAIVPSASLSDLSGYTSTSCRGDFCLARRLAECRPVAAHQINAELIATDQ